MGGHAKTEEIFLGFFDEHNCTVPHSGPRTGGRIDVFANWEGPQVWKRGGFDAPSGRRAARCHEGLLVHLLVWARENGTSGLTWEAALAGLEASRWVLVERMAPI